MLDQIRGVETNYDPVLGIIIDLTLEAEREGRLLYQDAITAPYFYTRYVRRWITNGVRMRAEEQQAAGNLLDIIRNK